VAASGSAVVEWILRDPLFRSKVADRATRPAGDTAWEDEAALQRALEQQHARAKHEFRSGELSPGVWTSVWQPLRLNRMWTRCATCSQPHDVSDDPRACANCGAELPPRPSYW
jgi:hypothetical protein